MGTFSVVLAAQDADQSAIGPGSLGFWVLIGLLVTLFVLYRSMRKQVKRVDFDDTATTDEGRMRGHRDTKG
ncbi:MAG: hypothetical protein ACRDVZ_11125 [Jiangellaceae bacterium]